jgi:hypothetical protein
MMLQEICLKVEFIEFVIQILKKAVKLASETEVRRARGLGRSVAMPTGLRPAAQVRLGGAGGSALAVWIVPYSH